MTAQQDQFHCSEQSVLPSVDTLLDSRSGPHYGETDCTVLEKARAEIMLLRMIWEIMHI